MNTLNTIVQKYHLVLDDQSGPIQIPQSRETMGTLLNDLGFRKGVEIGVYRGKFTVALAKGAPDMELTGVDGWAVYPGYKDDVENDLESEAYDDAVNRTKDYPNIHLVKAWSTEAAKMFDDQSLDFIYIDANHDFEHCVEDLAAWSKKVKKGGILSGHDYAVDHKKKVGVVEAVSGWMTAYEIKPLFIWEDRTPSWMFVKP